MKSGASAELFSVGRPSSLAGLFGNSSCRLPFLYCNRARCRTKLVRAVLLLMITFRYACWEPWCRWEEEVVGQMSKNYNQKTLPYAAVAINLFFPSAQVFLIAFSLKSKILKYKKLKSEGTSSPCLICILPSFRSNTWIFFISWYHSLTTQQHQLQNREQMCSALN